MKHRLKNIILPLLVAFSLTMAPFSVAFAAAGTCPSGNSSKGQVLQGVGESGSNCDDSGVAGILKTVVQILSFIAGAAAVIMIVIAGIRFTTSGGDSNAVSGAKNSLIFALIGLVIVAMSQVIVHFVLNAAINHAVNASG